MKTVSNIRPEQTFIEIFASDKCNVLFAENVEENDNEYEYDLYVLKNISYHENLENNINSNRTEWLQMAMDKENEVIYTEEQKIQQMITDAQIETLEIIMGGNA